MDVRTTERTYEHWIGLDAYDRDGEKIGEIDNVFLDTETGRPEWLSIKTGWFGLSSSLAPIVGSSPHEDGIRIDVEKDVVKDAPNVDETGALSVEDERRLYDHYHVDMAAGRDAYTAEERAGYGYDIEHRADEGYEVDDTVMSRREEELEVGKTTEPAGKVRLRKYVTTDEETVTVPVEKERVVVEREPVDGPASEVDLSEEEAEIELREEKVHADKRAVEKERIRAGKERLSETEQVQADVRKEHVEVEGDHTSRRR